MKQIGKGCTDFGKYGGTGLDKRSRNKIHSRRFRGLSTDAFENFVFVTGINEMRSKPVLVYQAEELNQG